MSAVTLLRLSGVALMVALALVLIGGLLHPQSERLVDTVGSNTTLSHALFAVAFALVLLGLPGLYAALADRAGIVGLVGFVLMMLLSAYHVYMLLYEAGPVAAMSEDPAADRLFAAGGVVQQGTLRAWLGPLGIVAPVVFGIAMVRARIQPRWAGWAVVAFVPAFLASAGLVSTLLPEDHETAFDLWLTPVSLALTYGLLLIGLAIPGHQLWRTQRLVFDPSTTSTA
jgi:hypothetical protein